MKILSLTALLLLTSFAGIVVPNQICHADAIAPVELVKGVVNDVKDTILKDAGKSSEADLDAKLEVIAKKLFDFDEMSKRCLGPSWNQAKPEEQKEFIELFSKLLSKTYMAKIKKGATNGKIVSINQSVDGDKAIVKSRFKLDDQEVQLDYRMYTKDSNWRIYDVIIENVGLVSNFRSEFGQIVKNGGMKSLLTKLRAK